MPSAVLMAAALARLCAGCNNGAISSGDYDSQPIPDKSPADYRQPAQILVRAITPTAATDGARYTGTGSPDTSASVVQPPILAAARILSAHLAMPGPLPDTMSAAGAAVTTGWVSRR